MDDIKDDRIVKVEALEDEVKEAPKKERKKRVMTDAQKAALAKGREGLKKWRQSQMQQKAEKKVVVKEVSKKASRKAREMVKERMKKTDDMEQVKDLAEQVLEEKELEKIIRRRKSPKKPKHMIKAKSTSPALGTAQETLEHTFEDEAPNTNMEAILPVNSRAVSDRQISVPAALAESTASINKLDVLGEGIEIRLKHLEERIGFLDHELERSRLQQQNRSGFIYL